MEKKLKQEQRPHQVDCNVADDRSRSTSKSMLESKIRPCMLSPSFLNSNALSHATPFSALAELIDNAYDPDVFAKNIEIDVYQINCKTCMTVTDDGYGMDAIHLWRMLSFGFTEKNSFPMGKDDRHPIGQYGNGFKSGSMRLAKDALVFTCNIISASVGFLSQTFHEEAELESIVVPIITYNVINNSFLELKEDENWKENLDAILQYSIYNKEGDLKDVLSGMLKYGGTKILLYNLSKLGTESDDLELDFDSDSKDIRMKSYCHGDNNRNSIECEMQTSKTSLRVFCSILFRVPRMKIKIRGQKVMTLYLEKSLSKTRVFKHRFHGTANETVITCGLSLEDSNEYGLMIYHRKRLIKGYERIGVQTLNPPKAVGVIMVVETTNLTPTHNKQKFREDQAYKNAMFVFRDKLKTYCELVEIDSVQPEKRVQPDYTWVQCDTCNKWRRLPEKIKQHLLPDKWLCRYNSDESHNSCEDEEEPQLEDEFIVSKQSGKRKHIKKNSPNANVKSSRLENPVETLSKLNQTPVKTFSRPAKHSKDQQREATSKIDLSFNTKDNLKKSSQRHGDQMYLDDFDNAGEEQNPMTEVVEEDLIVHNDDDTNSDCSGQNEGNVMEIAVDTENANNPSGGILSTGTPDSVSVFNKMSTKVLSNGNYSERSFSEAGVQTEEEDDKSSNNSMDVNSIRARFESFKEKVVRLLSITDPEMDVACMGDIECVIDRMLDTADDLSDASDTL